MGSVFSDSWFKVSNLRVSLIPSAFIKKQKFRGTLWYILQDDYNNQYFKIKPEAYEFVVRLRPDKTVEEVWEECLKFFPDSVPTQDEVIHLLTSLHHKNLLYFKNRADNEKLQQRADDRKKAQLKGKLISFLYMRFPLWDPDSWLDSIESTIKKIFSLKGLIVWLAVILMGVLVVIGNFEQVKDQTNGMLAPSNLFLLYGSIILLKTFHEFSHIMMVKRFGGKVKTMGVMLLVLTPIPYMDATHSWLFRSKYERALVGAAGMIAELFLASLAAIVWANTGEGIVNSIAFNMMIIGSLSSIIFNGNPLLRFDSYFMLSDLLEIPNLYDRAKNQWFYIVEKYVFKIPFTHSYADTKKEAFWLLTYGVLSFSYRLFVVFIISIYVADQWFVLGVIIVVISLYMWIVKPLFSFMSYLFNSSKLYRDRSKVIGISAGVLATVLLIVFVIPFPFSIKAGGIVGVNETKNVYIQTEGYLEKLHIKNGDKVEKGDVIATFSNRTLDFNIEKMQASIEESSAYLLNARENSPADVEPIKKHLNLQKDMLALLEKQKEELTLRSEISGVFISPQIHEFQGTWFKQSQKIGFIVPRGKTHFLGVVLQEEAYNLFQTKELKGSVKLHGLSEKTYEITSIKVIPYHKNQLPSAALGWLGGGEIATNQEDRTGTRTLESFFEVRGEFKEDAYLLEYPKRSGVLKIELDSLTLSERVTLWFKQLVQKRYRV